MESFDESGGERQTMIASLIIHTLLRKCEQWQRRKASDNFVGLSRSASLAATVCTVLAA